MQVRRHSSKTPQKKRPKEFNFNLTLYDSLPEGELSLEEIQSIVSKRLLVHQFIERKLSRNVNKTILCNELTTKLVDEQLNDSLNDVTSHLILRLGCTRNDQLRNAFIKAEEMIFRSRFNASDDAAKRGFLDSQNMFYKEVRPLSKTEEGITHYKIPFENVLEMVANREVDLVNGFANVPANLMHKVVFSKFRSSLSHKVAKTVRILNRSKLDERLEPLVSAIANQEIESGKRFSKFSGQISLEDIEDLAVRSFPPCMRNSYEHLKRDSHLKHGARMHFSLFLKAIGLPFKEALRFWRMAFSKKTDSAKFDKLYSYFIKHNYGKAGSGISYDPYSCSKIINCVPNDNDHCGCPFKLFDKQRMDVVLRQYGLSDESRQEILVKQSGGHFQVSCGLLFSNLHPGVNRDEVQITHPNEFFERSRDFNKKSKD